MKLAVTSEDQRIWMAQWRSAEIALKQMKHEDLQTMTEEEACTISDMLLNAIISPRPTSLSTATSGLIEQQRIFTRARR